jgi:hypothetical protein
VSLGYFSGNAYRELRDGVATAPVAYTDDAGWRIHGEGVQLMAFDTDQATVFQIRSQHRNEEVRELIPADYAGVMVTDRGRSYEAEELEGVKQQKCLDHLDRNIDELLETKTGRARGFGLTLKELLQQARQLWRNQRAGKTRNFASRAARIEQKNYRAPAPAGFAERGQPETMNFLSMAERFPASQAAFQSLESLPQSARHNPQRRATEMVRQCAPPRRTPHLRLLRVEGQTPPTATSDRRTSRPSGAGTTAPAH